MPKASPLNPPASRLSEPGQQPLALCIVRAGYSWLVSPGHNQLKGFFFFIAVDYFTKWAKTKALTNIRDVDV